MYELVHFKTRETIGYFVEWATADLEWEYNENAELWEVADDEVKTRVKLYREAWGVSHAS